MYVANFETYTLFSHSVIMLAMELTQETTCLFHLNEYSPGSSVLFKMSDPLPFKVI